MDRDVQGRRALAMGEMNGTDIVNESSGSGGSAAGIWHGKLNFRPDLRYEHCFLSG